MMEKIILTIGLFVGLQVFIHAQTPQELVLQGIILDESGQHYEAITTFNIALQEDFRLGSAFFYRGRAKSRLQDYHGAIRDFTMAINRIDSYAEAYLWRGKAYKEIRKQSDAIKDFDQAIEIYPSYKEAFYHRGLAKIFLNDRDGGCIDFSHAGELGYIEAYNSIRKYCN